MTSNAAPEAREVWSIGDLRLDVGQQRLWRGSDEIVLPKLSFDLLLVLTRRAPDVVTYDELMDRVWPGLVVSPETIVQRVRLLRTAIGDDASDPRYVEALRSRGYRLVAAAARVNPTPTMAPAPPPQPGPEPGPDPLPAARAFPWAPALVALAVIALAGWLVARRTAAPDAPAQPSATTAQLEASARTLRTVAVLPFDNLSADPADAFIALAVSESMLDRLAALRGLTVIARDSAFRAGRETRMARETGALLGASWLVEGSVQRAGERLRVAARLVDARADAQVWSERYERPLADLPALQDEIGARLVDALATRLAGLERGGQGRGYSRDLAATLAFLRGRALLDRTTVAGADAAAVEFEESITKDPGFAAAHAALYDARLQAASLRRIGLAEARTRNAPLLARAFELDPEGGAALLARARWSEASAAAREADFRRGLELEPSNSRGINGYAEFLQREGRAAESSRWLDRELLVDPLSAPAHFRRAMQTLGPNGAEVEQAMLGVLERDPEYYPALQRYSKYRWQLHGEIAQAIEIIERAIAADPDNPWGRHTAAAFYLDVAEPGAAADVAKATLVSADSTRAILALYDGRDADAARAALARDAARFAVAESWGSAEALRDAALRAGAPRSSVYEERLRKFSARDGGDTLSIFTYRIRIMLAQLRMARANRERDEVERDAARADLQALITWMDANERFGLHHYPRAQALMLLGDSARALDELAASFSADHDYRQWWYMLDRDPTWATVRSVPRFKAIRDAVRVHVQQQREALAALRAAGKVPRRGS
ncbi:MAG: winged helix-turn-helix domain-containing protein [Steroidobacteraceae bacterium]